MGVCVWMGEGIGQPSRPISYGVQWVKKKLESGVWTSDIVLLLCGVVHKHPLPCGYFSNHLKYLASGV